MTRETKIGLLVGLAFIIVIGILLSDHMSSTTEPPQASVGGAGNNVRDGVTTPGGDGTIAARAIAPQSQVPMRTDLNSQQAPPPRVSVGPGGAQQPPITIRQTGGSQQPMPEIVGLRDLPPVLPGDIDPAARGGLRPPTRDAVPLDPSLRELVLKNAGDVAPAEPRRPQGGGPGALRTYAAETGDSVSRIAAKMYGVSNKSNRDLLIKANPALQAEGNPVIAGKTYVIPNAPGAPAGRATADNTPPAPRPAAARETAGGETWYVVRDNDNLWRIAESQLGNGNLWTQVRDANKDVLKGGETVHPNMRLRLPAKPLASASAN